MFTLMTVSQKMMDFLNKMNVPFSIFRIILKTYKLKSDFYRKN